LVLVLFSTLAACEGYVPLPSPLPSPTPTRTDEVVIPFESLATNFIRQLPGDLGEPAIRTDYLPALTSQEFDELRSQKPQVFLVAAPGDVATFQVWLPPETLTALAGIDYSQRIALALFPGVSILGVPTIIRRIATSQNGTLVVYAVTLDYGYGLPADTFPSHIVLVQRADVPFPVDEKTRVTLELSTEIVP
jgi:hypothetical protein